MDDLKTSPGVSSEKKRKKKKSRAPEDDRGSKRQRVDSVETSLENTIESISEKKGKKRKDKDKNKNKVELNRVDFNGTGNPAVESKSTKNEVEDNNTQTQEGKKKKKKKNRNKNKKAGNKIDTAKEDSKTNSLQDNKNNNNNNDDDDDDDKELYPYLVEPDDHCETPEAAYSDIAPFLTQLSQTLGKSKENLSIYDPYYCEGHMVERMASIGFENVYNKKEDFYDNTITKSDYDVLITNPPYSGDHMERLISFCVKSKKPYFLLLPNYVCTKDYYKNYVTSSSSSSSSTSSSSLFYIAPLKRYLYTTPKGRRQQKSGKFTSPFPTFWYCNLQEKSNQILGAVGPSIKTVHISRGNVDNLPLDALPDNHYKKKKERNALKRKKHKMRKQTRLDST